MEIPEQQNKGGSSITLIVSTLITLGFLAIGPIYYLSQSDERAALKEKEIEKQELEQKNRELEIAKRLELARFSTTTPVSTSPNTLPFASTKYVNERFGFEFINIGWGLQENTDPYYGYKSFVFSNRTVDGRNNYLSFMTISSYTSTAPPGVSVKTTYEKIGGKNAVVKSWEEVGFYKIYYITDPIPGWRQCDKQLVNYISCGKVMYYATTQLDELESMVSSIKFK